MSDKQPDPLVSPFTEPNKWWDDDGPTDIGAIRLKLYVSGMTPRSLRAIGRMREISKELLMSPEQIEIIDIYQFPHLAAADQVIASPTLVKCQPPPALRILGELADREQVLTSLGIDRKHWDANA